MSDAATIPSNGATFRMPGIDEHRTIIGQNGSGKTQGALWMLSRERLDLRPWICFEYKREKMFRSLLRLKAFRGRISPHGRVPKAPGLYLMQLDEGEDDEAVDDFLGRVHRRGNIGLYFDEAYMLPSGPGSSVRRILTQGRALRIPVIACVQRPVATDHFFFTEPKHLWVFKLLDREDRRTIARYAPIDPDDTWPRYYSRWYDVNQDQLFPLAPVPDARSIVNTLADGAPRHWLWG
jgi:hypothetical protein